MFNKTKIRKKTKVNIETEGREPQVFECNGIVATMLDDGIDDNHHGTKVCICGSMSLKDLLHLHDALVEETVEKLEAVIIGELSPADIIKVLLGGKKHESDR